MTFTPKQTRHSVSLIQATLRGLPVVTYMNIYFVIKFFLEEIQGLIANIFNLQMG